MDLKIENMGHGDTYLKDLELGKRILNILEKHYAGHAWFVDCNHESGHVTVQLMYEGSDMKVRVWKYGMLIHIHKIDPNTIEKRIVTDGGELLERYNMARRAVRENDIIDFMDKGVIADGMVM